jgi:hypothetical protein
VSLPEILQFAYTEMLESSQISSGHFENTCEFLSNYETFAFSEVSEIIVSCY